MTDWDRSHQIHGVEPAPSVPLANPAEGPGPGRHPSEPLEFPAIFQRNFGYVWHTLRRLGVPDSELEDLAHDVFFEVHRCIHRYDPVRSLRAWLFGFCFRIASQHRRRARHRFEVLDEPADRADPAPSALERVIDSEDLHRASRALEALDIKLRAVFLMHEVDGFSMPEIAGTLEIPLNTAYSRLRLARKRFRETVHAGYEQGARR